MPFATFSRVREVSSEDSIHLAENLINGLLDKKWKTRNAGEKSAYVILEMPGSFQITGIDIGNEHSAFVEVLVGKLACASDEFKEILITSSFMTPTESKSSNNINRVRCFNRDALVPSVAEDKWSLIKILCTQPFNKHVSYGLAFIKVHINNGTKNTSITKKNLGPAKVVTEVGKLKFRENSPDSESENSSSLFNRWKTSKHNDGEQTTAASIRMASTNFTTFTPHRFKDDQKPTISFSLKANDNSLDRNRETLLFGDETHGTSNKNHEKLERLSKHIDVDKKRRSIEKEMEINKKKRKSLDCSPKPSTSKSFADSQNSNNDIPLECTKKRQKNNTYSEKPITINKPSIKFKPFNQLLKGVVLVISGIQNPDRGDLRNKALALGAKYKADWDTTCTHLICAFKNTPKYNQVKDIGKIVTRRWIEKCYSSRKYLPWRRFALDSMALSKEESDEEIFDDTYNLPIDEIGNNNDLQNTSLSKSRRESEESSNTLALYGIKNYKLASNHHSFSSGSDTDDGIQRIQQSTKTTEVNTTPKTVDIYEASTDEEDYITEKLSKNK